MLKKRSALSDIMNRWKEAGYDLMRPRSAACRICGGAAIPGESGCEELAGLLCRNCRRLIPWIDEPVCFRCGRGETCPDCVRAHGPRGYEMSRSAVRYTPEMKAWLARYKYRGDERQSVLFGAMLARAYRRHYRDLRPDAIGFVPVTAERLEERGFNQAERMAMEAGRRLGIPVWNLLVRHRQTDSQSRKNRRERLRIGADMYEASGTDASRLDGPRPKTLILVDDVYTTGSTLAACATAIAARAACRIYGLTWAR
ncbi:ComF family protein [Paenibacillus thermoaerophilus]